MEVSVIVCVDKQGGISKNGVIPWKIKEDTQFFVDVTRRRYNKHGKNGLLMGLKTWQSVQSSTIIKDCVIIVVSTTLLITEGTKGIYVAKSLLDAAVLASSLSLDHLFICGGKDIYEACFMHWHAMPIIITRIDANYECDNRINIMQHVTLKKYQCDTSRSFMLMDTNNNKLVNVTFDRYYFKSKPHYWLSNPEERQYLSLLHDVLQNGDFRQTRNGMTWSMFGKTLTFDLQQGFPLFTSKKLFFRGIFEELLFFLKGDTNANHLTDKGVHIWDANTSREFLDSVGLQHYQSGDIGPMYGYNLLHYGFPYEGMDQDYTNKGFNQIDYVLNLLKTDPFSRRIMMTTYDPSTASQGCLYPCHGNMIQFYAKQKDDCYHLSCLMTQRSVDMICASGFGISSYALLIYLICEVINNDKSYQGIKFKPGHLTVSWGDTHIYEDHRSACIRQLLRDPYSFPQLKINRQVETLTDFKFEDFELVNYQCYPTIKVKMVA